MARSPVTVENSAGKRATVAKTVFWIGTIGDGLIALEWFAIALGAKGLPVLPSFFVGEGVDFRFAIGIGAIFMLAWTVLLFWGSRAPLERRGLLLLTGVFLFLAIPLEWACNVLVAPGLMSSAQLLWGTLVKVYLTVQFGWAYWYSGKPSGVQLWSRQNR